MVRNIGRRAARLPLQAKEEAAGGPPPLQPCADPPPALLQLRSPPTTDPPLAPAFSIMQLPLSDKGLKKLNESFRHYKHALGDEEVAAAITAIIQKSKKGGAKAELKVC